MAKITLDPIVGSYASVTALNLRFQQIEDEFNSDVLYRNNPVGEVNTMANDLDMAGFSILNASDFSSDDLYLGRYVTAPTVDKTGATLDVTNTGYIYFNTTSNDMWVWNGTAWGLIGTTQNSAASVTIADAGDYYAALNVEAALQELGSVATGEGASIIGVEDAAANFTATDVEGVLAELAAPKGIFELASYALVGLSEVFITGIPAAAKRVYIQFSGVSVTATSGGVGLQLANSGVVNQNGAAGSCSTLLTASQAVSLYPATAYLITNNITTSGMNGELVLSKQAGVNNWYLTGMLGDGTRVHNTAGGGSANSVVDSIRIYRTGVNNFSSTSTLHVYYEI